MILLREPHLSEPVDCPYFNDRQCKFNYFFAYGLTAHELDVLLSHGWRKFGTYFFMPVCDGCEKCIPVRVLARQFTPTKSQRRILRNAKDVEVRCNPLEFRDEIYELYREHSHSRFGKITDNDEFINSFYVQSCPALQTEYYSDGTLFAVGFLDHSSKGLSSVYFVFKDGYSRLSPGILGALKEVEITASQNLSYYYLGYYIAENRHMSYKNRFHPFEWYSWSEQRWHPEEELPGKRSQIFHSPGGD